MSSKVTPSVVVVKGFVVVASEVVVVASVVVVVASVVVVVVAVVVERVVRSNPIESGVVVFLLLPGALVVKSRPEKGILKIYNQSLRCCAARGSDTRFSLVGPTNVKACKSFLFTEKFSCIENKEHCLILLAH